MNRVVVFDLVRGVLFRDTEETVAALERLLGESA